MSRERLATEVRAAYRYTGREGRSLDMGFGKLTRTDGRGLRGNMRGVLNDTAKAVAGSGPSKS